MVLFAFMFYFYVSTYWLSILLKAETCDFYVLFGFILKTLWEKNKNTEGAWKRSLSV